MRVAFVTPRYGVEVIGGAESAARMLAERLVSNLGWDVEVFTTCALDYVSWDDHYPSGDGELNGVQLHRFTTLTGRQPEYYAIDARVKMSPRSASIEEAEHWVEFQGPICPDLAEAAQESTCDVIAFYPYLYYPTVATIPHVKQPAVLHPAAHDEPAIYLKVFRKTFAAADAFAYHTVAERELVQRIYPVAQTPQAVLGLGVPEPMTKKNSGAEILGVNDRPYLCSLGRVDDHKGSTMLAAFFSEYKRRRPGPLALAMVGSVAASIPAHPDIVITGAVAEQDKWDILADSTALVSPSAYESFSLVIMEAWMQSVPVVVNGTCAVTVEHCTRSGGGVWFSSYYEFEACLDTLLASETTRRLLARRGREYVEANYRWPVLIEKFQAFYTGVAERGRLTGPGVGL